MLYLLSEEKSRKSRILDETFWKSLEYRRDFYFRENVIPYSNLISEPFCFALDKPIAAVSVFRLSWGVRKAIMSQNN